jgi:hypothetical protein
VHKKALVALAVALVAIASVAAHLYVQSQVYYPVVRLDLADGLSITALLPETKERRACGAANDKFVAPFKETCKDCKISMARCERELEGVELAMHDGQPVPHPMVVARELRMAVMGPAEAAKAGCKVVAANMVASGVKTAVCVQPQAATPPKS